MFLYKCVNLFMKHSGLIVGILCFRMFKKMLW